MVEKQTRPPCPLYFGQQVSRTQYSPQFVKKWLCVRAIKWKHFANGWVVWVGDPTLSQVFSKISVTVESLLDGWEVDAKCDDLLVGWGVDVRCDVI